MHPPGIYLNVIQQIGGKAKLNIVVYLAQLSKCQTEGCAHIEVV